MLTQHEREQLEEIKERWGTHAQTQPINIDAWAREDIEVLLAIIARLHHDAQQHEEAFDDNF